MRNNLDERAVIERNSRLLELNRELRILTIQLGGEPIAAPELPKDELSAHNALQVNGILEAHHETLVENLATMRPPADGAAKFGGLDALIQKNFTLERKVEALTGEIAARDSKLKTLEAMHADYDTAVARASALKLVEHGINPESVKKPKVSDTPSGSAQSQDRSGTNWTALCLEQIETNGRVTINKM